MASTIKSGSNNDLYIQTDGVDRIVVDSNGNTSIIGSVLSVENATGWGEAHLNGANGGDLILQDDGVNIGEVYAGVGHGMTVKSFAGHGINFITNNDTSKMTIDTAGRVTMPYQPGFHVANSGTPATSNFGSGESSLLHFDYVVSNVGSGWNTSSKRYTAPVTGRYMIYAQVRFDSLTTYSRCWVSTNGGTGQWWNLGLHSISPSGTFNLWTHTITGAIPLTAGDYIELRGGSNNSVGYHEGEGSFGGFLVG